MVCLKAPPLPLPQALTWNSSSLADYLAEASQLVKELDGLLASIKDAVGRSQGTLQQWQHDVMFERKEGRVLRHDELSSSVGDIVATRHAAVAGARDSWGAGALLLRCRQACVSFSLNTTCIFPPLQRVASRLPGTWRRLAPRSRRKRALTPGAGG